MKSINNKNKLELLKEIWLLEKLKNKELRGAFIQ
jgi:hypothetical protein